MLGWRHGHRGASVADLPLPPIGLEVVDFVLNDLPTGRISGTLRRAGGAPVPNAAIRASRLPFPPARAPRAVTDRNGAFEISGLPPGLYELGATPEGYKYYSTPHQMEQRRSLNPGQHITGVALLLE